MTTTPSQPAPLPLERIGAIPVDISVELGRARLTVAEVLKLVPGSVIELSALAGDALTLYVNGVLVAKGEAVVLNDHFGIRLTDVIAPADRAQSLGPRQQARPSRE